MKLFWLPLIICLAAFSASAQEINPEYVSALAKSMEADDYGMKSYVLVILKTGSKTIEDKALRDKLFAGHMENIGRLADSGIMVVAGPFHANPQSYRGIFILNVKDIEEARTILQTDPVIRENVLEAELFSWYGSAALPEYLKTHKKIQKIKIQ